MKNYSNLGLFKSKGRLIFEPKNKYRSPFQRDRDRIIHSASFRRLKHKTQVFVNTEGDHYRTRITHSIEVAQIARSIAKYLNVNDDLAETLSLAHDLGHTPLNKIIGKKNFKGKLNFNKNTSLEAQISAISDDIAYNNHDIQYGIKANLFKLEDLIEIQFFNEIYKSYKSNIKKKEKNIIIYQIIRDSINLMVEDVINNTLLNIKDNKIKKYSDIINNKKQIVSFSNKFKSIEQEIKLFLRLKMYNNRSVLNKNNNGKKIITKLFSEISNKPKKYINNYQNKDQFRSISDYISGMTDRYAIQLHKSLK